MSDMFTRVFVNSLTPKSEILLPCLYAVCARYKYRNYSNMFTMKKRTQILTVAVIKVYSCRGMPTTDAQRL